MENSFDDPGLNFMKSGLAKMREQIKNLERDIARKESELRAERSGIRAAPFQIGKYEGVKKAVALRKYLTEHGGEAHIDQVASDLVAGGVHFGKSNRTPQHHITILVASKNNNKIFAYDKATGMVSLVKGPATPKPPKRAKE